MDEKDMRSQMDKAIALLDENLRKLRTGRANVAMLEGVKVDAYGTTMPLNQVATITVLDFKTLTLQPWDKANIDPVMKAISASNLGMTPVKDNDIIRISIPDLTEERRKELSKVVGTYEEEAKIHLRQVRKDIIENSKNDKEATEDDVKGTTDRVDKLIKEYNQKISDISDKKREEMMTV